MPGDEEFTRLLEDAREGRPGALDALLPMVYQELRRVAARYMARERPGGTLEATALVHEAYLRLARDRDLSWQNRSHFCAIVANAMRQILVERARARRAEKRGGDLARVTLVDAAAPASEPPVDVEALDEALDRLAREDARLARVVELRYFGGLTVEETATVMDLSPATVKRAWTAARAWLLRELSGPQAR